MKLQCTWQDGDDFADDGYRQWLDSLEQMEWERRGRPLPEEDDRPRRPRPVDRPGGKVEHKGGTLRLPHGRGLERSIRNALRAFTARQAPVAHPATLFTDAPPARQEVF